MSAVFPHYLPPVHGASAHPPGTLFMACPGNAQPWGAAHPRPVYIAKFDCRMKSKKSQQQWHGRCNLCGARLFLCSPWWAGGATREQITAHHGPGVAVDEGGFLL